MTKKEKIVFGILAIVILIASSIALFLINGISINTINASIILIMCSISLCFIIVATYIFVKERFVFLTILAIFFSMTFVFLNLTIITMYANRYIYMIIGVLAIIDMILITVYAIKKRIKR